MRAGKGFDLWCHPPQEGLPEGQTCLGQGSALLVPPSHASTTRCHSSLLGPLPPAPTHTRRPLSLGTGKVVSGRSHGGPLAKED
jgi:hypothetical protein